MTHGTNFEDFLGAPLEGPHHVAYGHAAKYPLGVAYRAPWDVAQGGFPEHSRRNAHALSLVTPLQLLSMFPRVYEYTPEFTRIEQEMRPLTGATCEAYWAQVYQVVPSEGLLTSLTWHRFLPAEDLAALNSTKVFYIVLERDRVSKTMASDLNKVGQVWTTCQRSREALVTSGVDEKKIFLVPMPYAVNDPLLALERKPHGDVTRFYHIGKWEPRKAQDRLILNWMRAFKPGTSKLTIKTSANYFPETSCNYPQTPGDAVLRALEDPTVQANGWTKELAAYGAGGFRAYTTTFSEQQIRDLHVWGDVYLSLAHGEGWDMPAFDAALAGNRLVYTESGGPEEFACLYDLRVPSPTLVKADACYDWQDACYWDFEDAAVQAALLEASTAGRHLLSPERRKERFAHHAPHAVGATMLGHLKGMRG